MAAGSSTWMNGAAGGRQVDELTRQGIGERERQVGPIRDREAPAAPPAERVRPRQALLDDRRLAGHALGERPAIDAQRARPVGPDAALGQQGLGDRGDADPASGPTRR